MAYRIPQQPQHAIVDRAHHAGDVFVGDLASRMEVRRPPPQQLASLRDKVGVFEGAGCASKGLYRSMQYCFMIGNPKPEFCGVCQRALARRIEAQSAGR